MTTKIESARAEAYRKGWEASKRTTTYDLDSAEARFIKRNGREHAHMFANGWMDQACNYEFGYTFHE